MATAPHPSGFPLNAIVQDRLNEDLDQIARMERDLTRKVQAALTQYKLHQNVHGVFSIDDLENKLGADLCGNIGVGVGYLRIVPSAITTDPKAHLNVGGGVAVKMLDYLFGIIMAVPTGDSCDERSTATKVLTALRFGIMGSPCDGDTSNRGWAFVSEEPNVSESSDTMLYYSQVWRLAMPNVGNRQP